MALALRWAGGHPCIGTLDAFNCTSLFINQLQVDPSMHLMCTSPGAIERLVEAGCAESSCSHLVPRLSRQQARDVDRLRARWDAGDDTIVLAAMGEPASWTNLKEQANVAGRFGLLGHQVRLLVDPAFDLFDEALHWMNLVGLQDVIRIEPAVSRPWLLGGAIDGVLLDGHASSRTRVAGSIHLQWALDNALPVLVGPGHPAAASLEEREGAWCVLDAFLDELPGWLAARTSPDGPAPMEAGAAPWGQVEAQYERMASGDPANAAAASL